MHTYAFGRFGREVVDRIAGQDTVTHVELRLLGVHFGQPALPVIVETTCHGGAYK